MNQYIGRLLDDRYEILEVIGTGGMAVVYKALCHRLNRLVAIKILKDEFSGDEEFRRRFRAEGEAVAMLSHPNIVQVYDVSSSDTANYIVMELIDGISLKQYMEVKGVLNWKETLHFSMQIAKGLEHAHSRGIVHRDIKPHNVMVLKDGSVKVMDFGIARVMSKSNTLTKEALGSVHYISPEQAKGGYTDSRSDLYSLSVVMYEMMTGRPPFDGESPVAVAIQHINGGAPKPSTLNPNIPLGLEQIILKGMSLDPKDRYASATEMLQDMEEFRKNPSIDFQYQASAPAEHPIAIRGMQQTYPRTTAERVANAKNGTVTPPVRQTTGRMPQQRPGVSQNTGARRPPVSQNTDAMRRAAARKREEQRKREERNRIATIAIIVCSIVAVLAIGAFLLAVFAPGLYVMSVAFTPEIIPLQLLAKLAQGEQATPLPPMLEMLGVTLLLEIVREAGLRAPQSISHTVSLVGALILGETAVSAGILSVPILITAAAATIATLAVPSLYEQTILFRFAVIVLAGCFGVPGFAAAAVTVLAMACGSEPFGYDYLYPLMPPAPAAWRDGFVRSIWSRLARAGEVIGRDEA